MRVRRERGRGGYGRANRRIDRIQNSSFFFELKILVFGASCFMKFIDLAFRLVTFFVDLNSTRTKRLPWIS